MHVILTKEESHKKRGFFLRQKSKLDVVNDNTENF
jgi:hypothetical protein